MELHLIIDKLLCKMGLHRLNWQNGDLRYYHCFCGKAILNEDYPAVWRADDIEKLYSEPDKRK